MAQTILKTKQNDYKKLALMLKKKFGKYENAAEHAKLQIETLKERNTVASQNSKVILFGSHGHVNFLFVHYFGCFGNVLESLRKLL